ncbi:MAG: SLC13 family permease [Planctomycetota bacterium]
MSPEALITIGVLVGAFVLFVTEIVAVDVVGILVILALTLSGVLKPDEALAGLGNSALITVAGMFVLSAGLIRTGALDGITHLLSQAIGGRRRQIVVLLFGVAVISAFMNNTPVAIIFLPVVLGMCQRMDIAPSRLLIPLSFATILGGTCTLIGTSTNVLVSQSAVQAGLPPIGMFDFAAPGVIYAATGLLFLALFGPYLLPSRASVSGALSSGKVREFVTEISFPDGNPQVGKTYQELLKGLPGIAPLMVIRGEETYPAPLIGNPRTQFIRAGDTLLLKGDPKAINALVQRPDVNLPPELGAAIAAQGAGKAITLVEAVITPNSPLIGRTLLGVNFSARHSEASVLAILRRDEHLRERVSEIRLRLGDTLLIVVDEASVGSLRGTEEFVLLETAGRELVDSRRAPLAVAIMAAVVTLAALEVQPIAIMTLAGSLAMVLTGCLPLRRAYNSIDLSVLVLIAGMIALGLAFQKTGLVDVTSRYVVQWLQPYGPHAVMAGIFLLSTVLTALVSNNAVAVLLTPMAVSVAASMGLQPYPFVYAVLFGASCDFCTPIGYQTNLFVYGPGGYRFTDYVRIGVPLTLVLFAVSMVVIPWWFPFEAALP